MGVEEIHRFVYSPRQNLLAYLYEPTASDKRLESELLG